MTGKPGELCVHCTLSQVIAQLYRHGLTTTPSVMTGLLDCVADIVAPFSPEGRASLLIQIAKTLESMVDDEVAKRESRGTEPAAPFSADSEMSELADMEVQGNG